jgi:hypothetical protein
MHQCPGVPIAQCCLIRCELHDTAEIMAGRVNWSAAKGVRPEGVAAARELSIHWHLPDAIKDMTPQQLRALTSGTVGAGMHVNSTGSVAL